MWKSVHVAQKKKIKPSGKGFTALGELILDIAT